MQKSLSFHTRALQLLHSLPIQTTASNPSIRHLWPFPSRGQTPPFFNLQRIQSLSRQLRPISQTLTFTTMATPKTFYTADTPDSVKNAKGIHLLTVSTPNGQKTQILLEELKTSYGLDSTFTLINMSAGEQKKDWFLAINPNGRIPVIIDNTVSPPFSVHETSAQLVYLADKFDPKHLFSFADPLERSEMFQWLFFWHGSGAPYMGNTGYFKRVDPPNPAGLARFHNESLRVFGVLEIRLSGKYTGEQRDYLAGNGKGRYSIADIGTWPWVKGHGRNWSAEEMSAFPNVLKWIDRIAEREAVKTGSGPKYSS
jgi:glutathione S-transferase